MTSRQPIIDIVELITNLIASTSHLQELIDWEEDVDRKDELQQQLYELVDMRRAIMKEIQCKDNKYWCSLKHAIAQRGFAIEILYATRDMFRQDVVDSLTKYMYKTLSAYMWLEISDCGRCLADQLALEDNKKDEGNIEI